MCWECGEASKKCVCFVVVLKQCVCVFLFSQEDLSMPMVEEEIDGLSGLLLDRKSVV